MKKKRDRHVFGPSLGERAAVTFQPLETGGGPYVAEGVPLAGGVVSDVRRGENAGRKLAHEFIALGISHAPLTRRDGVWVGTLSFDPKGATGDQPASALAVWVHRADDPTPLQAVGGWLPK